MAVESKSSPREVLLGELFVTLADTLVTGFDLDDLLDTLVTDTTALLPVDDAALFLADANGTLRVAAATTPTTRAVETLVLEADAGPCIDAYRLGETVGVPDVDATLAEWELFARILRAGGFHAAHAIPMRLRESTIGVLTLFSVAPFTPSEVDAKVAQAIAHAATIAIIQFRAAHEQVVLADQLQRALDSRVVIEQAKGVVSQTRGVSMNEAFGMIRSHARKRGATLADVSKGVVERTLTV
jgi:GAF domain-containing protein